MSGANSCQSAVLMNNLAESYSNMGHFEEAKVWGQKGLDLAQNPNTRKVNKDGEICDETCGVLLFNMGMIFEVYLKLYREMNLPFINPFFFFPFPQRTNDKVKATQFYESARKHGSDFKQSSCIKEANRALKRIEFEKVRDENPTA